MEDMEVGKKHEYSRILKFSKGAHSCFYFATDFRFDADFFVDTSSSG